MTSANNHLSSAIFDLRGESRGYKVAKRVLDVTIALLILFLFSPLWIGIAALIRLISPGPSLHRLYREVGMRGREFTMYKFRTMHYKNDDSIHRHVFSQFMQGHPVSFDVKGGIKNPIFKIMNDPRVTSIGRILRKTGIDEIPQLFNVLRGEMSIVGPRPSMYYEYELYAERDKRRLDVLPGITGLYQVTKRSQVSFEEMVGLDLEYLQNRSLWLDLKIMMMTPLIMITGKGAH